MLQTERLESPQLLVPARAHRPVLVLPEDPSDDELLRHWTLSEADRREVLRCRGDDNRRRFALQLCALRLFGRFVPNHTAVPVRILNYRKRSGCQNIMLAITPSDGVPCRHGHPPLITTGTLGTHSA